MSKRSVLPQSRRHVLIYDEDWEYLSKAFASKGLGPGVTIRQIAHLYVKRMREREQEVVDRQLPHQLPDELEDTE